MAHPEFLASISRGPMAHAEFCDSITREAAVENLKTIKENERQTTVRCRSKHAPLFLKSLTGGALKEDCKVR
jgi:hypothetical protein